MFRSFCLSDSKKRYDSRYEYKSGHNVNRNEKEYFDS